MRGARVVYEHVLSVIDSHDLLVYLVWTPVIAGDDRASADQISRSMPESRVKHYWDGSQELGWAYGRILPLPGGRPLGWDLYMIFGREADWEPPVPVPTDWMHQLGRDDRTLDGERFRGFVQRCLTSKR